MTLTKPCLQKKIKPRLMTPWLLIQITILMNIEFNGIKTSSEE